MPRHVDRCLRPARRLLGTVLRQIVFCGPEFCGIVLCATVLLGPVSTVRADRGVPRPPASDDDEPQLVGITVKVDAQAKHAVLQIPAGLAPQAQPDKKSTGDAGSRSRTMIAGLAMSLALGSLVFVRRSSRSTRIIAGLVVAGVVVAGAVRVALADIAPPPSRPDPRTANAVEVQFVKAEQVTLLVPPGMLERLLPQKVEPKAAPR